MASKAEDEDKSKVIEEKQNTEEVALQDVREALLKLREALPKLTKVLGGSITDLVGKLQNCLPEPPARSHSNRRHQRRYHTVGVTPEEVAKAKEWIKQKNCQRHELIRMKFEVVDYKAGCFMEPAPQAGVLSYLPSPTFYNDIPEVATPPATFLSLTPEAKLPISNELPQVNLIGFVSNECPKNISSSDDDETIKAGKNSISSHRSSHIKRKLKRSNTLEVPRHNNFDDSQDELTYNSDQSETKRNTNYSTQKSDDHDSNKSDDIQKYLSSSSQEDQSKVHTYNPSARGGKHWSNRFSKIKTAFEELSSDEKEMVSPNQKIQQDKKFPWNDHQQNHKLQAEKKLPWNDNPKPVPDFPVYPSVVSVPSNQFTHAPLSRFKPVEKKNNTFFPSSVSGTVKQLVSQKFSLAKSDPQLNEEKPLSFTQRTLARFRPKKQKQISIQVTPSIDKNKCYTYTALNQPKQEHAIRKGDHNYIPKNFGIDYANQGTGPISKSHETIVNPPNNYTFNFDYDGVQARFQGIPTEKGNKSINPVIDPYYQTNNSREVLGNNYSRTIPEKEYNTYVPVNNENLPYQMNIPPPNVFYNNTSTHPRIPDMSSPSYSRQYFDDAGGLQRNYLQKSPSAHDYFAHKGGVKPDDFSNGMEYSEKTAVGRIMGEAQKRSVAVINPLVRSLSGLLPPKKPSAGHSLSKSPNTLKKSEKFLNAPDQPKIIHKSESCHQLVAQYLPPMNSASGKSVLRPSGIRRNSDQNTRDENKNPSNVHLNVNQLVLGASEDLDNVDEVFENIFKESNRSQSCK